MHYKKKKTTEKALLYSDKQRTPRHKFKRIKQGTEQCKQYFLYKNGREICMLYKEILERYTRK